MVLEIFCLDVQVRQCSILSIGAYSSIKHNVRILNQCSKKWFTAHDTQQQTWLVYRLLPQSLHQRYDARQSAPNFKTFFSAQICLHVVHIHYYSLCSLILTNKLLRLGFQT